MRAFAVTIVTLNIYSLLLHRIIFSHHAPSSCLQRRTKLHTAIPTSPIHESNSVRLSTLPLLGFPGSPVDALAGSATVWADVLVADMDALVVVIDVDSDEEDVERGTMVLLVV